MLSNSAYLFAAKILGYGIRILLPVFLVRILTKTEFGLYNQFFLFEVMVQMVFQMGSNQSQFFFIPRDMKNAGAYFLNNILLNLTLFTIAYILIGIFRSDLSAFLGMPVLELFYWHLTAYSILMVLNVSSGIYLTVRKLYIQAAVYDVLRQLLASAATLIAAYLTRDIRIIISALVFSRLLGLLVGLAYIHFKVNGFKSERYFFGLGRQVRYGVVLGIAGLVGTLLMRLHEITVSKFYDLETYAVYAAGMKQIPILQFYAQSVAEVSLSRFALLDKQEKWNEIREFWDRILGSMYGVGIPVTIFFIFIAKPLILLMFTEQYADAVVLFQVNSVAMLFHLVNPTLVLRAMDRNDISVKVNLSLVLLLPFALYLGMKSYGLVGIISVHAVMLIASRVVNHAILNRLTPVHLPFIASRASILAFYADSWNKGMDVLRRVTRR